MYILKDTNILACDEWGVLNIIYLARLLANMIKIGVPVVLIIICIIDLAKMMTGKEEGYSRITRKILERFMAAIAVFLVFDIVMVIVSIVGDIDIKTTNCFKKATLENINSIKATEEEARVDLEQQKKEDKEKQKEEDASFWKQFQVLMPTDDEDASSGDIDISKGSKIAKVKSGTANIFIGDSRTVGMCITMTGDATSNCSFSNNGGKKSGKDLYVCEGSKGYAWFKDTALPYINKVLKDNPDTRYNIYTWMGVNFLLNDIDKYISIYNQLVNGKWKNHKVILVSVGPVKQDLQLGPYVTHNKDIEKFNSKLKKGVQADNVSYCDIYSQLGNDFGAPDGLHYDTNTYKKIYKLMKEC